MNPAPEISGKIEFLALAKLLKDFYQWKTSGQLLASSGEELKKIYLKNGFITFSSSNQEGDRLGNILLERGVITQAQFDESTRQVLATGKKQGTILIQMRALSPKELFLGLICQVKEIILTIFEWEEGNYKFLEGLHPQEEIVSLRIHPASLILEGVERVAKRESFHSLWNPRALNLLPQSSPPLQLEELNLPMEAKKLLTLLERNKPIEEMSNLIGREEDTTAALLFALNVLELITATPRPDHENHIPSPPPEPTAEEPLPAPEEPTPAVAKPEVPDPETVLNRTKIKDFYEKLDRMNFYQVLNLQPRATRENIKNAYITMAKDFHPDRFFHQHYEDLHEQINDIFMKINEAYSILHNPRSRADYDKKELRFEAPANQRDDADRNSLIAQEQFQKGVRLLNAGEAWASIESFRWAVNLDPQNPLFHTYLGVALTRTKKRLHEAEEHCKTAIALDYNNPQFYVHLGEVYKTGRLFQRAKKQFEMALKLDPKYPQALKALEDMELLSKGESFIKKIFKK